VVCFRLRISIEVWQTYLGVVTIWKGADEGVRMGNLGCLLNLIGGGIAAIQYVVFDAPLKQGGLLQVSDVFAIKQNFTCKIQIF
jgi:hypothetical protein